MRFQSIAKLSQEENHHLMSSSSDLDLDELESSHLKPNFSRRSSTSVSDISMDTREDRRAGSPTGRIFGFRLNIKQVRLLIGLVIVVVLGLTMSLFWNRGRPHPIPYHPPEGVPDGVSAHPPPPSPAVPPPSKTWIKPSGFKIVGMVFYGRPRYVNILDCYLKKNLVTRGGYLDEVRFMMNTKAKEDIQWLDELIKTEPLYRKIETNQTGGGKHYNNIWNKQATENDTMYIKIDDDVVFVHEDAIPRMVHTLLDHPEAHDVAANIINSPLAHWLHYHTEAILPYLPETTAPPPQNATKTWRASKLPRYPLDANVADKWEFPKRPNGGFNISEKGGPPYKNHRWLPMEPTSENLMKTPVAAGAEYNAFGKGWVQWTMAAQQHYSLLEHMEKDTFDRYWAGNRDGIWNMQYSRYNLNFLAIWGSSVAMMDVVEDDEEALTVMIPKALKRPCIVDTHALIGHFQFGTTPELGCTDLLDRYLAYANEMVCEADNQRAELDPKFLKTRISCGLAD